MRIGLACGIVLLTTVPGSAADPIIRRDVAYAEPANPRQTLDVFAPGEGMRRPVVLWIHGGGWRRGDKSAVQQKPRYFVERGFVFVSTNYRFVPQVTVPEMTRDIARAIRWVHEHATEFGGDPSRIVVMGHSAGAHLAALVATDERYLRGEGLSLAILKGCVPVDTAAYDIPKRIIDGGALPTETLLETFGKTVEAQRDVSPAAQAAPNKSIPPFLILHVASRPDSTAQSNWFAERLRAAGVEATVFAAQGKNHGTINSELGRKNDPPTAAMEAFLDRVVPR